MGRTPAREHARNLLREFSIEDPTLELRKACAHLRLCASGLRAAVWQAHRGDSGPLERIVASLEDLGVSSGMARRICGFPAIESDALKRRRDGATEDGAGCSKAARATPAAGR